MPVAWFGMEEQTKIIDRLKGCVNRERLVETAIRLIEVPSRTGEAGGVLDRLGEILTLEGFAVERVEAGHPAAPAVAMRLDRGGGRTLQFNGHLDTVHLPFVPPSVAGDLLKGSGAADMKGGTAAAIEAVRAVRDSGMLQSGTILLTAHDLHEAPWGDGRQLENLIRLGYVGDAVLLPEPLCEVLPVAGRGSATWKVRIRRPGPPVHEVMRPRDEPSVIAAAAELVARLGHLEDSLAQVVHPVCGPASVFIGQIHGGEIFNQFPQECWLEGTRRWLPGTRPSDVEREFRQLLAELATATGARVDCDWFFIRDSFALDAGDPFVSLFRDLFQRISGRELACGPKPFVDDGNTFQAVAGVPTITHGPRAGGQHTVAEWVSIDDLARLALLYGATAVRFCNTPC